MSYDFKITNKTCDHILRGIPYFISWSDNLTLLPRQDPTQYLCSDPVFNGHSELKMYNQATHSWIVIPKDDPEYGWSLKVLPIVESYPILGASAMVRFKKRQQCNQRLWRLSYQVTSQSCLKCSGANVVSDIELVGDPDRAYFVQYEAKLAQDFLKFLLTPIGSNPYYPWMGTQFADFPGTKLNNKDFEAQVIKQIQTTADTIKSLQSQQVKIPEQQVSLRELLSAVTLVKAEPSLTDPRQMYIKIELMTGSRTLTNLQFPLSRG